MPRLSGFELVEERKPALIFSSTLVNVLLHGTPSSTEDRVKM